MSLSRGKKQLRVEKGPGAYLSHGIHCALAKFVGEVIPLDEADAVLALEEGEIMLVEGPKGGGDERL